MSRSTPDARRLMHTDCAIEARATPDSVEPLLPMFDDQALSRALSETREMDAATATAYIAAAFSSRHGGWPSGDTALLALRIP